MKNETAAQNVPRGIAGAQIGGRNRLEREMPSILSPLADIRVPAAKVAICWCLNCKTRQGVAQSPLCEPQEVPAFAPEHKDVVAINFAVPGVSDNWRPKTYSRPPAATGPVSETADRRVFSAAESATANGAKTVIETKRTLSKNHFIVPRYHNSA